MGVHELQAHRSTGCPRWACPVRVRIAPGAPRYYRSTMSLLPGMEIRAREEIDWLENLPRISTMSRGRGARRPEPCGQCQSAPTEVPDTSTPRASWRTAIPPCARPPPWAEGPRPGLPGSRARRRTLSIGRRTSPRLSRGRSSPRAHSRQTRLIRSAVRVGLHPARSQRPASRSPRRGVVASPRSAPRTPSTSGGGATRGDGVRAAPDAGGFGRAASRLPRCSPVGGTRATRGRRGPRGSLSNVARTAGRGS